MRIGAHESIAGGHYRAFERASADGAEALQIFTKSGRQWAARPLGEEEVRLFRAGAERTGLPVIAHASYLVNLGAPAGEVREKSVAAFRDELERCERLGIPWLVVHPGANPDEAQGLELVVEAVKEALFATAGAQAGVLFEGTAGQGSCLGHRFEQLARLLDGVASPGRSGVCLDSCHLFAAGYDLATDDGYDRTMRELDRLVGAAAVRALHLNDAKKGLGCRVDRHEHIGEGTLGLSAFARLVRDERFSGLPALLETPPGKWPEEVAMLKALRDGRTPARPPVHQKTVSGGPRGAAVAKAAGTRHSTLVAPGAAPVRR